MNFFLKGEEFIGNCTIGGFKKKLSALIGVAKKIECQSQDY